MNNHDDIFTNKIVIDTRNRARYPVMRSKIKRDDDDSELILSQPIRTNKRKRLKKTE